MLLAVPLVVGVLAEQPTIPNKPIIFGSVLKNAARGVLHTVNTLLKYATMTINESHELHLFLFEERNQKVSRFGVMVS